MRKVVVAVVLAGMMLMAMGGSAFATHPHHLEIVVERGGADVDQCVDRGGVGFGTGQDHGDSTAFHNKVHKGQPGLFAFERANNPVFVDGGTC